MATAVGRETVVVGVRPVDDPASQTEDGASVDRADRVSVASPMVLPAGVVAALGVLPTLDFAALVAALRARFPVTFLEAPPDGRAGGVGRRHPRAGGAHPPDDPVAVAHLSPVGGDHGVGR